MKKSRSVMFREFGPPESVLYLEEDTTMEPRAGEVLIRVTAAPINPADLNQIEGKYPIRPDLPAVAGVEGAGIIEKVGPEITRLREGDQVLFPTGAGSWREYATVPETGVVAVPGSVPAEQAAMLRINPPTAFRMLHDFVTLERGEWIIQNAGNSAVGRWVIAIAKSMGLRTINVVRRAEVAAELTALGADAVLVEGEDLPAQIEQTVNRAPIRLALNGVGGESALRLAGALAKHGVIVTYGAMGRQPLRIPNGMLIFKNLVWTGFWISAWYKHASAEQISEMLQSLHPLLLAGGIQIPVASTYPLERFAEAVQHAAAGGRNGKVLFKMEPAT